MIFGVDRSGDEGNFPMYYVAVELADGKIIKKIRQLVNARDQRKGRKREIKSTDLVDKELQCILKEFKGNYYFRKVDGKEVKTFKESHANKSRISEKFAYLCYKQVLKKCIKPKDEVWLCRDLDEDSMKNIKDKLERKFEIRVNLSDHEGNIVIADWIAGALKRNIGK
jgi:hypothetical protein